MDLHHLRYFVAVTEPLSFRRAAGRLPLSRPPLTRQIQTLEAELAVRLLERERRRVVALNDTQRAFVHNWPAGRNAEPVLTSEETRDHIEPCPAAAASFKTRFNSSRGS